MTAIRHDPLTGRKQPLGVRQSIPTGKGGHKQMWETCVRCGRRNQVRVYDPNYVCLDCQVSDPHYMRMVFRSE